jgi:hypothetical protein
MASKFRESPHSRRRGLQTPPHLHLGESGQSGLERETGAVCVVIGVPGDGIGCPATRAKALNLYTERSRGFENPLPRTEVRGWHNGLAPIGTDQAVACHKYSAENVETPDPALRAGLLSAVPSGLVPVRRDDWFCFHPKTCPNVQISRPVRPIWTSLAGGLACSPWG